jgi:hypothetical protein
MCSLHATDAVEGDKMNAFRSSVATLLAGKTAAAASEVAVDVSEHLLVLSKKSKQLSPTAMASALRAEFKSVQALAAACAHVSAEVAAHASSKNLARVANQLAAKQRCEQQAACRSTGRPPPSGAAKLEQLGMGGGDVHANHLKRKRVRTAKLQTASTSAVHTLGRFGVEQPMNGQSHSPAEIGVWMQKAHEHCHGGMKQLWMAWRELGWIVQRYEWCTALRTGRKSGPYRPPCKTGRPPKAGEVEDQLVQFGALVRTDNFDLNEDNVREILEARVRNRMVQAGVVPSLVTRQVSDREVTHTLKLVASAFPNVDVNRKKQRKNRSRLVAERSVIAPLAFAGLAMASHLVLGGRMPTGYKGTLTHQMVVKAFGDVPHGWQEIVCNVDELGCFQPVTDEGGLTREYISLSKSTPNDGYSRRFTPTANSNTTGARAGFVPGCTIRTSVITSSDGRVGSFHNVVFLKPGYIKNDAGILFLTVNGFTGGGNNPAVKNHGFIVLVRAAAC